MLLKSLGARVVSLGLLCATTPAVAVPSYSRQTGEPCTSCHIGAYGPALTPHGRAFKLNGYSDGKTVLPLSATGQLSFAHTAKDQAQPASEHDGRNDNVAVQEVLGFIAGGIAPHVGTFIGVSYSEPERHAMLDHFDVRYAQPVKLAQKDAVLGLEINNNPGSQDIFDSLPAWRFPHEAPELVPEKLGMPLLGGLLEGQVVGLSTYLWFNESIYAEIAGYRSLNRELLRNIGVADEAGRLSGIAPYGRLAYQKDWGKQVASLGVVGMRASLHPEHAPGPTNKYADWGLDATYQYLGNRKNIINATLGYLNERQKRDFDFGQGLAERRRDTLNSINANVGWWHHNTYGLTAGLFHNWGTRDRGLFSPGQDSGSRTGRPDSDGYVVEADWVPFGKEKSWGAPYANLKVGVQFTGYLKFNGAKHDYDGFGRDASDNNTLFTYMSVAF